MFNPLIYPDWPAPDTVQAVSTTRQGGFSLPPFDGLNLGLHVGDHAHNVEKNRVHLIEIAKLPESPRWLNQVHGTMVSTASTWQNGDDADAIISTKTNQVCAIMTADCLPILLCNQQGTTVAAIHAGWRSLAAGIIEKTLVQFNCPPHEIIAWFGPAIGPTQFEVGTDVYQSFSQHSEHAQQAFVQTDATHYLADIYLLAKQRLNTQNIHAIFGGDFCTVSEPDQFFSYRRDGITGRMASMIWTTDK
ncbi:MAG: multi-copper polyphenol oxidoreductase [Methylophaga sp.]|nr:MAG: multi-copper polyphenol oxidoreductase [Methylophaga sp.]